MLFRTLASSGIEYKPADFKAEAHFLGQIVGASNIIENDSVFIEAFFDLGKDWRCLSPTSTIQTQTCFVDEYNFACFAHPFDLHLTTENIFGWPRLIVRLWKLDDTNQVDLISFLL